MRLNAQADERRAFLGINAEISWERRFHVADDGTEIAYDVAGDPALPTLLLCDGIGCAGFIWKYLCASWVGAYRVIHPYYRGHGASSAPRDLRALTIADLADDFHGILDAEAVDDHVILGHSMGVQVSLEMAHRRPSGCRGLVLICGSYGNPLDTFHGVPILKYIVPVLKRVATRFPSLTPQVWKAAFGTRLAWYVATLTEVNPALARKSDIVPYMDHLKTVDPEMFFTMLNLAGAHSAERFLGDIEAPSLIVAGSQDGFTPPWLSQKMGQALCGAEVFLVSGGSHVAPLEAPEAICGRIEEHLQRVFAE
jgi:pimeloyl-ACP methyl ester carboxylesterase